jgi:hypothetical protein
VSIIADAMRKSAREKLAHPEDVLEGSRRPDTTASGRWDMMAELEKSNAALREFLLKAKQDDEPQS